ncbi:hypothetical protein J6590_069370, partial [Homalodisca vitripennis]
NLIIMCWRCLRGPSVLSYRAETWNDGRDNLRGQQHRTAAFSHLTSQVGVRLINKLPESTKQTDNLNHIPEAPSSSEYVLLGR